MPLRLHPPRASRSKNWRIRGTYLRVSVDRSAGTPKKHVAERVRREIERDIERGVFVAGPNFAAAVVTYLKQGGERRFIGPLLEHFKETPLARIDQAAVDEAAATLYPPGISEQISPHNATINRQVHTPVSAILASAGINLRFKRPKQPTGRVRWISPETAEKLIESCSPNLHPLVIFLLYTGCRISEATGLKWRDVELNQSYALVKTTKNGDPRGVHLPPVVVAELANMGADKTGRVFAYAHRAHVYPDWHDACEKIGLEDFTPHDLCHTWATWMRRYGGRDERGLVGTGRWRNRRSVDRYVHVVVGEDGLAADNLPNVTGKKPVESRAEMKGIK